MLGHAATSLFDEFTMRVYVDKAKELADPKFTPYERLDAADPISFGMYATPDYYLEFPV